MFSVRFALLFALLVFPWPGFRPAFAEVTERELAVLKLVLFNYSVEVGLHDDLRHQPVDIEVRIVDPRANPPADRVQVKIATFDSRSLAWMPHAMIIALCTATPLSWPRKWRMLLAGVLTTHVFVLMTFLVGVAPAFVTGETNVWLRWTVLGAHRVLVENLWTSFVVPCLVWLCCVLLLGTKTSCAT
jgi:hypothetical protein